MRGGVKGSTSSSRRTCASSSGVKSTADKHKRAVLLRPENFHILTRADVLTDESIYLFVYELPLLRTRLFLVKGSRDIKG